MIISLISLNQVHHLQRLLPTLKTACENLSATVMLVANRCTDNTVDFVKAEHSYISLFVNDKVTGYGGNHNINLFGSESEFFVIMNSDMLVKSDTFEKLLAYMEQDGSIGIIAPKVLNEDGSIQYLNKRYPAVFDLFLRKFCPKFLAGFFAKRMCAYEMRDTNYSSIQDVPLLSGSFMMCRTSILRKIGGFDERFFLYFEDYDLCRRFQNEGYRTVYYPEAEVAHFWERSAHKNCRYALMFINSACKYFNRWGWKLF